ncbi:MAG: cytochrome c [Paracoccaceae bacterium]|nr:cytochrome c [Paracoccaceae bacterium]
MSFVTKTLVIGLVLAAGVAIAKEGVQDPTVKARMDLMAINGKSAKTLGQMAAGETAFDAAAAEAAKAALIDTSSQIAAKFETQASDPVSEALPVIWTNWDEFTATATRLNAAATALDASSLDGVKAGMAAIGGTCKDCHTTFRLKK